MDAARQLREARRGAALSQRELAGRVGTSQATLSAYETGRKVPTLATFARILDATGAELRVAPTPGGRTRADLERAGGHLRDALALAEVLPFRRPGALLYPRLPPGVS